MKNLIVLAVASLFATSAVAAEMKWTGSAGWRYQSLSQDDSLGSLHAATAGKDVSTTKTKAYRARANLGVMGGWEHVEYGFGLRTGGAATTTSDWVTVNGGGDLGVGIEQAWFRYVHDFGGMDLAATIGRQKNAMATDSWETLFDRDTRWDGFGWNFKFGMFGLNAVQYILGSTTHSPGTPNTVATHGASSYSYTEASQEFAANTNKKFSTLFGFQPHMSWKFTDEIEAMFAVAWYKWAYEGDSNGTGGGVDTTTLNNRAGMRPAVSTANKLKMDNNSQWDVLMNVTLPMNMAFSFDWVKANKAYYNNTMMTAGWASTVTPQVSTSAWTAGLSYGKLAKAHDFMLAYAYGTKGIGSVINTFTNGNFLADNKGHTIKAGYALADNMNLGFRWIMLQEKERLDSRAAATAAQGAGAAYSASDVANADGSSAAGTAGRNSDQKMKQNYWELTAGVAF